MSQACSVAPGSAQGTGSPRGGGTVTLGLTGLAFVSMDSLLGQIGGNGKLNS